MIDSRRYNIDLPRHMAECDANYIRLLKLVPELESAGRARPGRESQGGPVRDWQALSWRFAVTPPGGGQEFEVSIRVIEAFRYTTTLEVEALTGFNRWSGTPRMDVRVYHDAATAEAVAYQGHRGFEARYATPNGHMYHQDEKKQINEFLGEWLRLCLSAGRSLETPAFLCTV